jgi:hypothetical protein
MDNNNSNVNDLNNMQKPNVDVEQSNITQQSEQTTTEELNYRYLKKLNKQLTLFKKGTEQSEKKDIKKGKK